MIKMINDWSIEFCNNNSTLTLAKCGLMLRKMLTSTREVIKLEVRKIFDLEATIVTYIK